MNGERAQDWLREVCIEAARQAGRHALDQRHRRGDVHQRFAHDIKLKLDHECQETAMRVILGHFPGDSVLGEEWTTARGGDAPEWIVDPIDGTVNFFHGLSWWCSSVAVRHRGRVVAGAVYAPEVDQLFDAMADGPARLNGETIRIESRVGLADALVITGSEKELEPGALPLATAQRFAPHVQKIRILGAAAIDICQVASGAADLFVQHGLYLWDVAAAALIVERAGGVVDIEPTRQEGRYSCLACAHGGLRRAVTAAGLDS